MTNDNQAHRKGARFHWSVLGVFTAALIWGCQESPFGEVIETVSASIVTGDTTMFKADTLSVVALAVYSIGPGVPTQVDWGTSDPDILTVIKRADLSATVSAKELGSAYVFALINGSFRDSALLTVVAEGMIRWRSSLAGEVTSIPAIGSDSNAYVIHGVAAPMLSVFSPAGEPLGSFASCNGYLGPSVSADGTYVSGEECSKRHSTSGSEVWSASLGDYQTGVALAQDGGAVILHSLPGDSATVVVSKLAFAGGEVWRDTLRVTGVLQTTAPVIASNGDIFVAWRAPTDSTWLSRIGGDGTVLWTVATPGWSRLNSPALSGTRIVLGYQGGVSVFDAAGAVVWNRPFADDIAAASDAHASSPVVDAAGNVYVQTEGGLFSYDAAGTTRWSDATLGFGTTTGAVGGATLLVSARLVVPCAAGGAREVCGIAQGDGQLIWQSAVGGGSAEGIGIMPEGTVTVMRTVSGGPNEVVGLWSRGRTDPLGWPTPGGDPQRSRRQR